MKTYKGIMIFGCPGSGKSTLAKKLSYKLGLPLFHNDKLYFSNNWVEQPKEDFEADLCEITALPEYIIDGNCARVLLERDLPVDLVIYLDVPLWKCYWRVLKRRFTKDSSIDDRAPECEERLAWSFLKSMWGYKEKTEPRLQKLKLQYPNTTFVHVRSENELKEVERLLIQK